jgi:hypothetical protein
MSAILDEVRAETDFQHFLLHTLKRASAIFAIRFRTKWSLQNLAELGLSGLFTSTLPRIEDQHTLPPALRRRDASAM